MAITLQTIPTVPTSPLPNISSAETAFANNYYKLAQGVISTRERKALSIIGLIHELKAVRSIDYTVKHAQLIQDSQVFTGGTPMIDLDTAFAVIDLSNGALADAGQSLDLPTLLAEARDLTQLSEDQLNRIMILLECQLAE